MIKFPIEYRVGEVWGDQVAMRKCYIAMLEMDDRLQIMCIEKPTDGSRIHRKAGRGTP